MGTRKNGSYLPGFDTEIAAEKKAVRALTSQWVVMLMIRHRADADEPRDALEAVVETPEDGVADRHIVCFDCHFSTKRCADCEYDSETEH